jgi:cobalamin biosynthesis protein CobD/CbiB
MYKHSVFSSVFLKWNYLLATKKNTWLTVIRTMIIFYSEIKMKVHETYVGKITNILRVGEIEKSDYYLRHVRLSVRFVRMEKLDSH